MISSVSSCLKALNSISFHFTKINFSAHSFLHFCQNLVCLFIPLNFCCCLAVVSGNPDFKHVRTTPMVLFKSHQFKHTNRVVYGPFLKWCRPLCKETGFTGLTCGWILFLVQFIIKKEKRLCVEFLRLFLVIVSFSLAA